MELGAFISSLRNKGFVKLCERRVGSLLLAAIDMHHASGVKKRPRFTKS
jgi:hypothetical protein